MSVDMSVSSFWLLVITVSRYSWLLLLVTIVNTDVKTFVVKVDICTFHDAHSIVVIISGYRLYSSISAEIVNDYSVFRRVTHGSP